jgi:hypothetical protein
MNIFYNGTDEQTIEELTELPGVKSILGNQETFDLEKL